MKPVLMLSTKPPATELSLAQAQSYIEQLDLSYIVAYMCSEHYPLPRWTQTDAEHCCRLYKNFLLLFKKHFDVPLVPTREVDEFWHNHILYTRQYVHDCMNIYGRYLHHVPTSPDDEPEELVQNFLFTQKLYLAEFGSAFTLT